MSFDGHVFKSYYTAIACIYPDRNAVLLNTRRYSNTTTSHQSCVRRAIPDSMVEFFGDSDNVQSPERFAADLLADALRLREEANQTREAHPRRKSQIATNEARCLHALNQAQRVSEHFGLGLSCTMPDLDAMKERQEAARVEREKQNALRIKRAALLAKKNLRRWLAGESIPSYSLPSGQTYLRLVANITEGDRFTQTVETSKGITIPLDVAQASLNFVFGHRETGWHRNGETFEIVGYQLDSVARDGIVAGCHRIAWKELSRIQSLINSVTA